MAVKLGRWEALITVPTGDWTDSGNFTLTEAAGGGAQDITIAAGDYFWNGAVGGGTTFLAEIKRALDDASANGQAYTVTMTASESTRTQLVTISSTAAFTLAFGSNDGLTFLNLLGSTSDPTGSATSHTFDDNNAQAIWLPDQPPWVPTTLEDHGSRNTVQAISRSPGGAFHRWTGATVHQKQIVYRGAALAKTKIDHATVANESFEAFWDHSIGAQKAWSSGCYWRWYQNADGGFTRDYHPIDPEPMSKRLVGSYRELWEITMNLQEVSS